MQGAAAVGAGYGKAAWMARRYRHGKTYVKKKKKRCG